jgi:hypothetical protein
MFLAFIQMSAFIAGSNEDDALHALNVERIGDMFAYDRILFFQIFFSQTPFCIFTICLVIALAGLDEEVFAHFHMREDVVFSYAYSFFIQLSSVMVAIIEYIVIARLAGQYVALFRANSQKKALAASVEPSNVSDEIKP